MNRALCLMCGCDSRVHAPSDLTLYKVADMKNARLFTGRSFVTAVLLLSLSAALVTAHDARPRSNRAPGPVASKGGSLRKVSTDLRRRVRGAGSRDERIRVILQTTGEPGANLQAFLAGHEVKVHGNFRNLNTRVVELPLSMVDELAADGDV